MADIKEIAGHLAGLVDQLPLIYVTFDAREANFRFDFGDIGCALHKHPRSAQTIRPPWLHYELTTARGGSRHADPVPIWLKNPSGQDPERNRAALRRALELFRDTPTAVMVQVNVEDM
ncbi:hypothetical protein BD309DRAFT_769082 [Dichomitus squalens]|uniref:Uncharacterized protein n=1 Tax=Dichomitus squalens TaxID=114155 RepID=A0A4Q9NB27_9APHY|nr:hypothetical protein BD309DRAFT_769082 [Dichomitus squalens]TBU54825.1 hypothetical protein BD310DRAFT_725236 [Dichomitus squalens]